MGCAKGGRYFLGRKKQNGPRDFFAEKRSRSIKNKTSMPQKSVHTFGSTKDYEIVIKLLYGKIFFKHRKKQ